MKLLTKDLRSDLLWAKDNLIINAGLMQDWRKTLQADASIFHRTLEKKQDKKLGRIFCLLRWKKQETTERNINVEGSQTLWRHVDDCGCLCTQHNNVSEVGVRFSPSINWQFGRPCPSHPESWLRRQWWVMSASKLRFIRHPVLLTWIYIQFQSICYGGGSPGHASIVGWNWAHINKVMEIIGFSKNTSLRRILSIRATASISKMASWEKQESTYCGQKTTKLSFAFESFVSQFSLFSMCGRKIL